jgi:hypothetical protein
MSLDNGHGNQSSPLLREGSITLGPALGNTSADVVSLHVTA